MAARLPRRADLAALAAILALTCLVTSWWASKNVWTPDGIYYQARVLEIRGESRREALIDAWHSPLAMNLRTPEQAADPAWAGPYPDTHYRRRVSVPIAAAAVYDFFGSDSLPVVAILGCFAIGPLLYMFLRQRFNEAASLTAVVLCLLWPPLRWGFLPLTDSWGIAVEVAGLLAAVLVLNRGFQWLPLWIGMVLLGAFTRDISFLLLVAAATVAVVHRTRVPWRLTWTAAIATLPAPLIAPQSIRDFLAEAVNNHVPVADPTWGFIAEHYPSALRTLVDQNFDYLGQANPLFLEGHAALMVPLAILFALALVLLLAAPAAGDHFMALARGSLLGGAMLVLLALSFSYLRLELVFLPPAAVGIALGVEMLSEEVKRRSRPAAPA